MKKEVCIGSFEVARAVEEFPLDRIEVCSALEVGGLTPSHSLIEFCSAELGTEAHIMIRPRAGGFDYSGDELRMMRTDIKSAADLGADGVVFGVLDHNGKYDKKANEELSSLALGLGLEVTFHRAFDVCEEPWNTLDAMMEHNFTRVLSSGRQVRAIDGIDTIKKMVEHVEGQLQIMAGGSVNQHNAQTLAATGIDAVHFSAAKSTDAIEQMKGTYIADIEKITAILTALET